MTEGNLQSNSIGDPNATISDKDDKDVKTNPPQISNNPNVIENPVNDNTSSPLKGDNTGRRSDYTGRHSRSSAEVIPPGAVNTTNSHSQNLYFAARGSNKASRKYGKSLKLEHKSQLSGDSLNGNHSPSSLGSFLERGASSPEHAACLGGNRPKNIVKVTRFFIIRLGFSIFLSILRFFVVLFFLAFF